MVDIFDEVDEELRAENAQKLLKRYAGHMVVAAVLVVAVVAGWKGWQYRQAQRDVAAASAFLAAAFSADSPAAQDPATRDTLMKTFDALVANAPDGYRTLARLRAAALKADSGDLNGAAALWDQVAGDGAVDPLLRDFATLMWAEHQLDQGDPSRIEARLKPLTDPANAWRSLAQEQLALLEVRQGHTEAARDAFRKLSLDVTAPAGVRNRATALLSRLGT